MASLSSAILSQFDESDAIAEEDGKRSSSLSIIVLLVGSSDGCGNRSGQTD